MQKRRYLLLTFGLIVIGLILALVFLHTETVKRFLVVRLHEYLENRYDLSFELSDVDYNLLQLSASARDVSFRLASKKDLPDFLNAGQIHVDLSLLDLLLGEVTIEESQLEGVSVSIVVDEAGQTNLPSSSVLTANEDDSFDAGILISSLILRDGSFSLEDRARQLQLDMPGWAAEVRGEKSTGSHTIDFSAYSTVEFRFQEKVLLLDQLETKATFGPEGLQLDSLKISSGQSHLEATGLIPAAAGQQLDVQAAVSIDAAQFSQVVGIEKPVRGFLNGQLTLRDSFQDPTLQAHIEGKELSWSTIDSMALRAEVEWKIEEDSLTVMEALVESPRGSIFGAGHIALAKEAGDSQASIRIAHLDVLWLSEILGSEYRVASLASGDARLTWPGLELSHSLGTGSLSLSATSKNLKPGILPVNGTLSFNSTQEKFLLSAKSIETAGIHWTGRTEFRKAELLHDIASAKLQVHVTGYADDVASSVNGIAGFLGKESFDAFPLRGKAEFTADLNGTIENPHASFSVQAPEIESSGFDGIDLKAQGEISRQMVMLSEASAQWRGGVLNLNGSINLQQPEPELDFTSSAVRLPLRDFLTSLGSPIPLEGEADAELTLSGTFQQPELVFEAFVPDLQFRAERLGSLELNGRFADAKLDIPTIVLSEPSPGGRKKTFTAGGYLDLTDDTFLLEAEGHQFEISSMQLAKDWEVSGLLNLSLQASGTLGNPEIDLELGIEKPSISTYELPPIQVDARLRDARMWAELLSPTWGLSAVVTGGMEAPYPIHFLLSAKDTNLGSLPFRAPEGFELSGSLTGELEAEGNISDWRHGELSTTLTDLRLIWNGVEARNLKPVSARYFGDSFRIEESVIVIGNGSLEIEGNLPLEVAEGDASIVAAADLDVVDLMKLLPGDWPLAGTGKLGLKLKLAGSLEDPELSGQLRVDQGSLSGSALPIPINELAIDVSFDKDNIQLDQLSATAGGGFLKAQGVVPVKTLLGAKGIGPDEPLQISASLEELPLESLGFLPSAVKGLVTAQVELAAQDARLPYLAGSAAFGQFQLNVGNLTLRQEEPILLSLQNGQIWLERFGLTGPDSQIKGSGGVDFLRPGALDLEFVGKVSTSVLAELVENLESSGAGEFQLVIKNLPRSPSFSGTFSIAGGRGLIPSHHFQIDELDALIHVTDNHFQIDRFAGDLNGGSFKVDGTAGYSEGTINNIDLLAVITGVFVDWPEGLKTISDGVVALRSKEKGYLLDGELRILEGAYREPVNLEGALLQYLRTGRRAEIDLEPNPLLSGLGFEIGVEAIEPIAVDNNLAEVLLEGRVQLVGNYDRPGMTGVITVNPGGEVYLRERTYVVEYGAISFLEETRIKPDLNILARTKAKEYDVMLQAVGPLGNIRTTFSSEPALAEPDIISILLTGRTLEELRGAEGSVATEQALSLLVGAAGGQLTRQAENALGLSKVRIEPYLIASESTPEARLTVGQDLASDLRAIYSLNLVDSGDQIWVAEYDVTRRFRTRGIKQADNTYRLDFNHQLRLGATKKADLFPHQRRVGTINFEGSSPFPETVLHDKFNLRTGRKYDFFKAQKGVEKVQGLFTAADLLEARIRLRRAEANGNVNLTMKIDSGLAVFLAFDGDQVSTGTQKRVRELWGRGVSDNQRRRESLQEIRRRLVEQGYVTAEATCTISLVDQVKHVTFHVQRGPQFRQTTIAFRGVEALEENWLQIQLREADLITALHLEPGRATDFLDALFRQRGYLGVKTESPKFVFDQQNSEVTVVLEIAEGPLYRVGDIEFHGNRVLDEETLRTAAGVKTEDVYYPRIRGETLARLEEFYRSKGYNRTGISDTAQPVDGNRVNLAFQITENVQDIVKQIEISGQQHVSSGFIARQMGVEIGEVMDLDKVSRARKNLYDTGAFSLVEIEPVEIEQAEAKGGTQRPMALRVRVRESVPHTINYGAFYDTERGPGVAGDYRNHNLLGNGRVFGVRGRFDADRREVRGYFSQPARRWFPLRTHSSAFVAREFRPSLFFDQYGFAIAEQAEIKETLVASLGFSFVKNSIRLREPDPILEDVPLNVGSLNTTLAWDTRDSFLDATRGHFFSYAFQYAPNQLGSDFPFVKYYGNYSRYFPLTDPSKIPFGGNLRRPRLIFATGVRVGLAKGFDQDIISPTERFFAGGGTTIRGFKQDTVGPVNENGVPVGGNSLFVWNNEIRFPMFSVFEGVGFLDVGNVYPTISDFNPLEVREAAGFGLRLRTPYFLVRVDYGFKLDRRADESRGALFFSIGQAF